MRTGRPGRVPGTCELVIPRLPYIIVYRLNAGGVDVVRVYHTSRMWPEAF
jgi:toxin ParE1/3/4